MERANINLLHDNEFVADVTENKRKMKMLDGPLFQLAPLSFAWSDLSLSPFFLLAWRIYSLCLRDTYLIANLRWAILLLFSKISFCKR